MSRMIWKGPPPGYHDATDLTCRECKKPLPNRRTKRFCTKACGEAYWTRLDWRRLRLAVFVRDNHTCVRCGFQDECMMQVYHEANRRHDCIIEHLQADHITPIADGGDEFDIDNVRTLCVDCHKIVTAAWRTEVAARKPRRQSY